jgi:drug/metabolite transporter (DMT)-like permease
VLVPLGAWAFLHESISPRRWLGIVLILAGIIALARPAAKAEEVL